MAITLKDQDENWDAKMDVLFSQLREDTILFTFPILLTWAILILAFSYGQHNWFCGETVGVGLFGQVFLLSWLRNKNFLAAALVLIIGSLAAVEAMTVWGGIPEASFLLVFPVGFAALTLGLLPTFLVSGLASLLIFLTSEAAVPLSSTTKVLVIFCLWGSMGMVWMAVRHLLTTMHTTWNTYERNLNLLEEARNFQVQLQQSLEDLREANVQLARLNQLAHSLRLIAEQERTIKEQFVANVSHELRTPLNMIIGFCEVILHTPETYKERIPSALMADLDVVLRNGQHLASLIDDVLDLSQIDAGQMALSKERTDFSDIIESAVIAIKPLYASKGLYIETEIASDIPQVYCDRTRVREVLLNLFSNAGRFTEQGGVKLKARRDFGNVIVSVTDTGHGIDNVDQEKLFKPFNQLNWTIQRRLGGTGLGLSISKNFVDLHGGKMWVESVKGMGTTFYFQLPIDPPPLPVGGAARWINPYAPVSERSRRGAQTPLTIRPRLAVVEEGDVLKHLLSRYFDGVELIASNDLSTAVRDAGQNMVHALLINNIHIDEVLGTLIRISNLPFHIPVLICDVPDKSWASASMGVSDYLVKPVSQDMLLGAIDRLKVHVKTILLVEDEPDAIQLFRRILSSARRGYRVLRATNGLQALEVLKQNKVDLILLDLIMPEMDGFQFLSIRHRNPNLIKIPVILLSARDPQGQPVACRTLAITTGKGISGQKLLSLVEEVIRILSPAWPPAGSAPKETPPS